MATTIRPAAEADVPQILVFIRALALYEREPDAVTATEADLLRDGFGPDRLLPVPDRRIRRRSGRLRPVFLQLLHLAGPAGRCISKTFSCSPDLRGLGIGKALLQQVAAVAVENGCPRLQWEVLDWNTPAIDFYAAMGAEFLDEWRNVRVTGEALRDWPAGAESAPLASQRKRAERLPNRRRFASSAADWPAPKRR